MPTLHWLTREQDLKASGLAPYRLLEHVETYGDSHTENMLIQGDNLDGLKALLPYYAGKVKCIYIDPPYNTRSAFEHYDDNLEHTKWLSMMYPRFELLWELLHDEGSIWITLDDNELHYSKVILDEVCGRNRFIASIVWENFYGRSNAASISPAHNTVLLYAKNGDLWKNTRNLLPRDEKGAAKYKNPDNDPRGVWRAGPIFAAGERHEGLMYTIKTPSGREVAPPKGSHWRMREEDFWRMVTEERVLFGISGDNIPATKIFLSEVQSGLVPRSWWPHSEAGHTQDAKREIQTLFTGVPFDTPKPERLIQNVIHIATNPGDLVLDSFLGSGTTAAVAHKMGRRYIGIEIGDHAQTHCIPRLQKVIDGEQGGISKTLNWEGGGGFRFYRLGEPIFTDDGQICQNIRFPQLAAHIWFSETKTPWRYDLEHSQQPQDNQQVSVTPFLGVHEGVAYYLLYNGILKDKSANGGNVLTSKILEALPQYDGPKVIYGERCLFSAPRLKEFGITFKHTPYDIKGR